MVARQVDHDLAVLGRAPALRGHGRDQVVAVDHDAAHAEDVVDVVEALDGLPRADVIDVGLVELGDALDHEAAGEGLRDEHVLAGRVAEQHEVLERDELVALVHHGAGRVADEAQVGDAGDRVHVVAVAGREEVAGGLHVVDVEALGAGAEVHVPAAAGREERGDGHDVRADADLLEVDHRHDVAGLDLLVEEGDDEARLGAVLHERRGEHGVARDGGVRVGVALDLRELRQREGDQGRGAELAVFVALQPELGGVGGLHWANTPALFR